MDKKIILKYTLLNAIQHDGKADVQAVLGKIVAEKPEFRNKIKELIPEIKKTVTEVNSWNKERQQNEIKKIGVTVEKKVEEKKELPDLPNAKIGKVVTVFPPEPSKYPHLGHAKAALVNYLYAKKYKGKFITRFEDTNPKLVKNEYYDAIINGLKWLGIKWDKLDYTSDHLEEFYKATEKLIKENKAYVCVCEQSEIKKNRRFMIECKCRNNPVEKNFELWKKMFTTFKEGEASVRIKISMDHKNAAMRDPSIMRIIDHPHPRTINKYRVWPMYDFATALIDGWEGVTHRVRSKEFEMRKELQQFIQKAVGLKITYITEMARFNLEGVPSSGRQIREMIRSKELTGWDDPRLTTLIALKKRGFDPEGIKEFLISTGVTKTESMLTWDVLESFNRSVIDSKCNRYFAVFNPEEIKIIDAPEIDKVKVHLHPDFPKRGFREIPVNLNKILISREDFDKFKGKEIRLIGLFNVKLDRKAKFTSKKLVMKMPKIQWVSEENVPIKIVMSDGSVKECVAEPEIKKLKVDDRIQLIRIGFTRIDQTKPRLVLYFTHR
ncbi:MAG: glutamate--tRNA ligase [Candidatus Aenigmarchaeota archaeon]|nr:glutamate--tRNA ligase [Candidatus Aenigmarchaeota archaeon]